MLFITAYLVVLALVALFAIETEPIVWKEYTVCEGETLCDIAQSITPNSEDYRETQHCIIKKNSLENAMIYPGQKILIPCKITVVR